MSHARDTTLHELSIFIDPCDQPFEYRENIFGYQI